MSAAPTTTSTPLTTATPTPTLRAAWHRRALRRIEIDPLQPAAQASIIARNEQITAAYAELYLRNPQLYRWAGMAALTSAHVGRGMYQMHLLHHAHLGWLIGLLQRDVAAVFDALGAGNLAVFVDIYWQHLAYELAGLPEFERIHAAGELSVAALAAWRLIDAGRVAADDTLIWEGNLQLLYIEQKEVLQPAVYDTQPRLWRDISLWIESPLLGQHETFGAWAPSATIGNFEARWRWISTRLVPRWQALATTQAARVEEVLERRLLGGAPFRLLDRLRRPALAELLPTR